MGGKVDAIRAGAVLDLVEVVQLVALPHTPAG